MKTNNINIQLTDAGLEQFFKFITEITKEQRENQLVLEKERISANKAKWETAMKTMNKNGALDRIMIQVVDKFMNNSEQGLENK